MNTVETDRLVSHILYNTPLVAARDPQPSDWWSDDEVPKKPKKRFPILKQSISHRDYREMHEKRKRLIKSFEIHSKVLENSLYTKLLRAKRARQNISNNRIKNNLEKLRFANLREATMQQMTLENERRRDANYTSNIQRHERAVFRHKAYLKSKNSNKQKTWATRLPIVRRSEVQHDLYVALRTDLKWLAATRSRQVIDKYKMTMFVQKTLKRADHAFEAQTTSLSQPQKSFSSKSNSQLNSLTNALSVSPKSNRENQLLESGMSPISSPINHKSPKVLLSNDTYSKNTDETLKNQGNLLENTRKVSKKALLETKLQEAFEVSNLHAQVQQIPIFSNTLENFSRHSTLIKQWISDSRRADSDIKKLYISNVHKRKMQNSVSNQMLLEQNKLSPIPSTTSDFLQAKVKQFESAQRAKEIFHGKSQLQSLGMLKRMQKKEKHGMLGNPNSISSKSSSIQKQKTLSPQPKPFPHSKHSFINSPQISKPDQVTPDKLIPLDHASENVNSKVQLKTNPMLDNNPKSQDSEAPLLDNLKKRPSLKSVVQMSTISRRIANESERTKIKSRARNLLEDEYNWEDIIELDTSNVLNRMMGKNDIEIQQALEQSRRHERKILKMKIKAYAELKKRRQQRSYLEVKLRNEEIQKKVMKHAQEAKDQMKERFAAADLRRNQRNNLINERTLDKMAKLQFKSQKAAEFRAERVLHSLKLAGDLRDVYQQRLLENAERAGVRLELQRQIQKNNRDIQEKRRLQSSTHLKAVVLASSMRKQLKAAEKELQLLHAQEIKKQNFESRLSKRRAAHAASVSRVKANKRNLETSFVEAFKLKQDQLIKQKKSTELRREINAMPVFMKLLPQWAYHSLLMSSGSGNESPSARGLAERFKRRSVTEKKDLMDLKQKILIEKDNLVLNALQSSRHVFDDEEPSKSPKNTHDSFNNHLSTAKFDANEVHSDSISLNVKIIEEDTSSVLNATLNSESMRRLRKNDSTEMPMATTIANSHNNNSNSLMVPSVSPRAGMNSAASLNTSMSFINLSGGKEAASDDHNRTLPVAIPDTKAKDLSLASVWHSMTHLETIHSKLKSHLSLESFARGKATQSSPATNVSVLSAINQPSTSSVNSFSAFGKSNSSNLSSSESNSQLNSTQQEADDDKLWFDPLTDAILTHAPLAQQILSCLPKVRPRVVFSSPSHQTFAEQNLSSNIQHKSVPVPTLKIDILSNEFKPVGPEQVPSGALPLMSPSGPFTRNALILKGDPNSPLPASPVNSLGVLSPGNSFSLLSPRSMAPFRNAVEHFNTFSPPQSPIVSSPQAIKVVTMNSINSFKQPFSTSQPDLSPPSDELKACRELFQPNWFQSALEVIPPGSTGLTSVLKHYRNSKSINSISSAEKNPPNGNTNEKLIALSAYDDLPSDYPDEPAFVGPSNEESITLTAAVQTLSNMRRRATSHHKEATLANYQRPSLNGGDDNQHINSNETDDDDDDSPIHLTREEISQLIGLIPATNGLMSPNSIRSEQLGSNLKRLANRRPTIAQLNDNISSMLNASHSSVSDGRDILARAAVQLNNSSSSDSSDEIINVRSPESMSQPNMLSLLTSLLSFPEKHLPKDASSDNEQIDILESALTMISPSTSESQRFLTKNLPSGEAVHIASQKLNPYDTKALIASLKRRKVEKRLSEAFLSLRIAQKNAENKKRHLIFTGDTTEASSLYIPSAEHMNGLVVDQLLPAIIEDMEANGAISGDKKKVDFSIPPSALKSSNSSQHVPSHNPFQMIKENIHPASMPIVVANAAKLFAEEVPKVGVDASATANPGDVDNSNGTESDLQVLCLKNPKAAVRIMRELQRKGERLQMNNASIGLTDAVSKIGLSLILNKPESQMQKFFDDEDGADNGGDIDEDTTSIVDLSKPEVVSVPIENLPLRELPSSQTELISAVMTAIPGKGSQLRNEKNSKNVFSGAISSSITSNFISSNSSQNDLFSARYQPPPLSTRDLMNNQIAECFSSLPGQHRIPNIESSDSELEETENLDQLPALLSSTGAEKTNKQRLISTPEIAVYSEAFPDGSNDQSVQWNELWPEIEKPLLSFSYPNVEKIKNVFDPSRAAANCEEESRKRVKATERKKKEFAFEAAEQRKALLILQKKEKLSSNLKNYEKSKSVPALHQTNKFQQISPSSSNSTSPFASKLHKSSTSTIMSNIFGTAPNSKLNCFSTEETSYLTGSADDSEGASIIRQLKSKSPDELRKSIVKTNSSTFHSNASLKFGENSNSSLIFQPSTQHKASAAVLDDSSGASHSATETAVSLGKILSLVQSGAISKLRGPSCRVPGIPSTIGDEVASDHRHQSKASGSGSDFGALLLEKLRTRASASSPLLSSDGNANNSFHSSGSDSPHDQRKSKQRSSSVMLHGQTDQILMEIDKLESLNTLETVKSKNRLTKAARLGPAALAPSRSFGDLSTEVKSSVYPPEFSLRNKNNKNISDESENKRVNKHFSSVPHIQKSMSPSSQQDNNTAGRGLATDLSQTDVETKKLLLRVKSKLASQKATTGSSIVSDDLIAEFPWTVSALEDARERVGKIIVNEQIKKIVQDREASEHAKQVANLTKKLIFGGSPNIKNKKIKENNSDEEETHLELKHSGNTLGMSSNSLGRSVEKIGNSNTVFSSDETAEIEFPLGSEHFVSSSIPEIDPDNLGIFAKYNTAQSKLQVNSKGKQIRIPQPLLNPEIENQLHSSARMVGSDAVVDVVSEATGVLKRIGARKSVLKTAEKSKELAELSRSIARRKRHHIYKDEGLVSVEEIPNYDADPQHKILSKNANAAQSIQKRKDKFQEMKQKENLKIQQELARIEGRTIVRQALSSIQDQRIAALEAEIIKSHSNNTDGSEPLRILDIIRNRRGAKV